MDAMSLLESLSQVRWATAMCTYGNDHSTLIGLLVDWWVSIDPGGHTALEGGPTNGLPTAQGRGQCDALLCSGGNPVGVVEVEGTRHVETVDKVGSFFDARYEDLRTLEFGILLLYRWEAVGCGDSRQFPGAAVPEALNKAMAVSRAHPAKTLVVLGLEKDYERGAEGIRSRNDYYRGRPTEIWARLYSGGVQGSSVSLYTAPAS